MSTNSMKEPLKVVIEKSKLKKVSTKQSVKPKFPKNGSHCGHYLYNLERYEQKRVLAGWGITF